MNQQRAQLITATKKLHSDVSAANQLAAKPRGNIFVPPKTREVATLVDWIADHPVAKGSKSFRKLQEAYLESIGVL